MEFLILSLLVVCVLLIFSELIEHQQKPKYKFSRHITENKRVITE